MNNMILEQNSLQFYLGELAETNYYNEQQHLVRVKFKNSYYDMHLFGYTVEVPDPKYHLVMFLAPERSISTSSIDGDALNNPPGIVNNKVVDVQFCVAFLINRTQKLSTTNAQTGTASFAISNTNFYDSNNVRVAITAPTSNDYTRVNDDSGVDSNRNQSIGLFLNDDSVLIKSRGSSITLGDDGIHIGGNVSWEQTSHGKGVMARNQFAEIIPSSIPTAIISTPNIPNVTQFLMFAEAGQRVMSVINKAGKVLEILK